MLTWYKLANEAAMKVRHRPLPSPRRICPRCIHPNLLPGPPRPEPRAVSRRRW